MPLLGEGFPLLSILVGHSYFLRFDEKQRERAKPYPPLATLQVAALLRAAGHQRHLLRRHAGYGHRGLPAPSCDAARPRGRRVLRGQLQLPEQDVSRQDARCVLRNDRGRASARCPRRRRGLRCLGRTRPVSRGRRRCRVARRGARGADGARGPARRTTSRCPFRGSSRGCPTSARRSAARRCARARPLRCPSPSCRSCPLATSSTSRRIAPCGAARTATSASTWRHRAVARSAATGARSRSGAIATCSGPRPTSPPKCCA